MDNLVTLQPAPVSQAPFDGPLDVRAGRRRFLRPRLMARSMCARRVCATFPVSFI